MKPQEWLKEYASASEESGEAKAATAIMRRMSTEDPNLFDRLNDLAEETTFTTRSYGHGRAYCWPHHSLLQTIDPWPASRFPKAVLCVEFLKGI